MTDRDQPDELSVENLQARELREALAQQVAQRTGAAPAVIEALRAVPRHRFIAGPVSMEEVYRDGPFPIGHGQTISQPTVVALMTDALRLTGHERVLEIGTGSGYQAAVLSRLAAAVFTIEVVPSLAERARAVLTALGHQNVRFRVGDGYLGWPEQKPFDRIVLTAAPREVPASLLNQLAEGGMLVAPVGEHLAQRLIRVTRGPDGFHEEFLGAVAFVPMVHAERP